MTASEVGEICRTLGEMQMRPNDHAWQLAQHRFLRSMHHWLVNCTDFEPLGPNATDAKLALIGLVTHLLVEFGATRRINIPAFEAFVRFCIRDVVTAFDTDEVMDKLENFAW